MPIYFLKDVIIRFGLKKKKSIDTTKGDEEESAIYHPCHYQKLMKKK